MAKEMDTSHSQALLQQIRAEYNKFDREASIFVGGVKSKGLLARKASQRIQKLLKDFRKATIDEAKRAKGVKTK